jgi:DNA-directed RNA polymerase subunit RPC12/RpoP
MGLSAKYPTCSNEEITEWLIEMYVTRGRSLDYIAEKSAIDKSKVRRILLKAGVQLRQRGRPGTGDTETRRCMNCGGEFSLASFSRDKTKAKGRGYRCRTCDNLRRVRVSLDAE